MKSTTHDDDSINEINVTPLVDVVLVLLIVLMVTASYAVSKSIPLQLPAAAPDDRPPPPALQISIDDDGALYVDAERMEEGGLGLRLRAYVHEVGEDEARATIAAGSTTTHGRVVRVMDLLRREHVARIAFAPSAP